VIKRTLPFVLAESNVDFNINKYSKLSFRYSFDFSLTPMCQFQDLSTIPM